MTIQVDLFTEEIQQSTRKQKPRNYDAEAKFLLDKHGITNAPRELKALIFAKLVKEHFPEMHQLLLMSLATTSIKLDHE